jgi:hypothetical protein
MELICYNISATIHSTPSCIAFKVPYKPIFSRHDLDRHFNDYDNHYTGVWHALILISPLIDNLLLLFDSMLTADPLIFNFCQSLTANPLTFERTFANFCSTSANFCTHFR